MELHVEWLIESDNIPRDVQLQLRDTFGSEQIQLIEIPFLIAF